MAICTLEKIITDFRIGNWQLVAGCGFELVFLNRQLNWQLVSESLTGGRERLWYDKDRCGVIYGRIGVMYVLVRVNVKYSMCNGNRKL